MGERNSRTPAQTDIGSLDWDHIAEEIDGLAGSQRRELYSRIEVLLMHLLKWQVQTEHRSGMVRRDI
jgi:hypothetical protein